MEKRNVLKNQKGFTLIEIIAVLVILGILAAVAVPRFIDLQSDSRDRAVMGAIAAVKSQATMDYAKALLDGTANASSWGTAGTTGATSLYGDFTGNYTLASNTGIVTANVTSGPFAFTASSGTFQIYQ